MRLISKGAVPRALVEERAARITFAALTAETRREMREALVAEQAGLCCFCMARIRPEADVMRLAHLVPQSTVEGRGRALDWSNLFAACAGGERPGAKSPRETQRCDVRQADAVLKVNPTNPRDIAGIVYRHPRPAATTDAVARHAGYEISSSDPAIAHDLTEHLNLNLTWLCEGRAAALNTLLDGMRAKGRITEQRLESAIARFEAPRVGAALPPFAGFVAWWLRKRLGKR